jgi:LPS export ABC transporter protein LptC
VKCAFGVAFVLVILSLAGCTKIGAPPAIQPSKDEVPQQEFYNATITFYQGDKLNGVLEAGRIRKFEKSAAILLDSGVVMDFYNEQGKHTTRLWADSARTDENRRDMVAMGNVVAKSDSGETLETQILRWDNRTRQIRSDVPVRLMTTKDTINGVGFLSDEHLKNWRIESPQGLSFREMQKRAGRDSLQPAPLPDTLNLRDTLKFEDSLR